MPIDYNGINVSNEHTYFAASSNSISCPASTKSFFIIMGSQTKIIKISKIHLSGLTITAREYNSIVVRKISSIPVGGTAAALTKTPADKISIDSTVSLCQTYSVTPTTDGTLVGTIQSNRSQIGDSNPVQGDPQSEILCDFRSYPESSGIILRGVNDGVSVSFGSVPGSAITLSLEIEWLEID